MNEQIPSCNSISRTLPAADLMVLFHPSCPCNGCNWVWARPVRSRAPTASRRKSSLLLRVALVGSGLLPWRFGRGVKGRDPVAALNARSGFSVHQDLHEDNSCQLFSKIFVPVAFPIPRMREPTSNFVRNSKQTIGRRLRFSHALGDTRHNGNDLPSNGIAPFVINVDFWGFRKPSNNLDFIVVP